MKDTILEDYLFEKERIEFHCDEIINTIRLHNDLVFKTKKGEKFKEKLIKNARDIKYILSSKLENYFKKDLKYENFKHNYSTHEVIIHDLEKDPNDLPEDDEKVIIIYSIEKDYFDQKVATYNKTDNRFYVDDFTYIDTKFTAIFKDGYRIATIAKFIAWYKTIDYKEIKDEK